MNMIYFFWETNIMDFGNCKFIGLSMFDGGDIGG